MSLLGISGPLQGDIMRVLAGILHLGNVDFVSTPKGTVIKDAAIVARVADILRIDEAALVKSLLHRSIIVAQERVLKPLDPVQVESALAPPFMYLISASKRLQMRGMH